MYDRRIALTDFDVTKANPWNLQCFRFEAQGCGPSLAFPRNIEVRAAA
jgi:hypothetical protein